MVWRFMIEARDPEIITAALATQVQLLSCGVTEHTLFATGTPEPGTYNRGRVVLGTDCLAVFDVCTAWETIEGTDVELCTAEETFTVPTR